MAVPPEQASEQVYRAAPDPADHRLAHELAVAAGELLVGMRGELRGHALRAAGDRRSNRFLLDRLGEERGDDAVLSEESADDGRRLGAKRVWIVDPLDGTREYAEPGRTDWAVHVALWVDGYLAAGAVSLPATGAAYSTWQPPATPVAPREPVVLVSRSRPPAVLDAVLARWPATPEPMGSAGAKTGAVLAGRASAYVHGGGQYEWDTAAPVAVAVAAGFRVRRLDGSAPRYNRADPWLPDIVICHPAAADELWAALDEAAA
ncbi:MAG TPA: 3'(2'),5'-bisphosphate nucleotidase CysQ [Actinophytocola sp.]|jgi:3'(2'), 5'-bisphosphate nucleotidase|uniref:3'(2'),5'-bisphosphate nucleotidase CysQ n=1 Tax=Actinophytocola sp. TaxID=1872138 RepID=UPI002F9415A7